eukprot:gene3285-4066_t
MLTNFCGSEDGIFKDDINLHQFGIDCGEVITNAIVQELCSLQPTLTSLDISYSESVTDVGLWAIARHCTNMKILNLKGCTQITNIGLRSLSLRCSELVSLDFTNCSKLDDIGLSTVAGGCWKLERLILRNCVCISDTGVGRVSRACNRLKVLDLHGCVMVGEFGDHALKDIGAFCTDLRELDMTECKHVQDAGLRAVAVGCPLLRVLRLSGCDGVTGAGLRALSKHCRNLEELAIRGAKYLTDPELELLKGDVLSNCLKVLDLGGCVRVTDKGITTLCHSLGQKLLALNLAESCATDMSSKVIASVCTRLRQLDLRQCKSISDVTVSTIAEQVTGLTTLKLDGNRQVSTKAIARYLGPTLEFAELAKDWLGYQPRADSLLLIQLREEFRERTRAATRMQCMVRTKIAYNVYRERRRRWLVQFVIPKAQARMRGYLQRKRYRAILLRRLQIRMATQLQAYFRRYLAMRAYEEMLEARERRLMETRVAVKIQTAYRCMKARVEAQDRRDVLANVRLALAKRHAREQLCAIRIQKQIRGHFARRWAEERLMEKERLRMLHALHERLTRLLQRVVRGWLGRLSGRKVRRQVENVRLRWNSARVVQRLYRGFLGRQYARLMQERRAQQRRINAAVTIARLWRGHRGRAIAAMTYAIRALRVKKMHSVLLLQKIFRGYRGRRRMTRLLEQERLSRYRVVSVCLIQKMFRGHKGREAAEVERRL